MKREPVWRRYLRFFGPDVRADIDEEMQLHFDLRVQDYVRQGLSAEAAEARVTREFGDIARAKLECRAIGEHQLRTRSRLRLLDTLRRDLGFSLRQVIRNPGFSFTAVLMLGLGLGGAAAIFSVVYGVLLRPLPYPAPQELVRLYEHAPSGEAQNPVSAGNYREWQSRATSFASIGAHRWPYEASLSGAGEPVRVVVGDLTASTLQVLQPRQLLGRLFTDGDGSAGAAPVALLSYGSWRSRFGGDTSVIGRLVMIDETSYQIIGVLRPEFDFPFSWVDIWKPVRESELDPASRRSHLWGVVARLKPGMTVERAQADMAALARSLQTEQPQFMQGWGVTVVPLHADLVAPVRSLLLVLLGGVGLVLIIACTNVANLLLAQAVGREREMAVRGALGASRPRLILQLLVEAVVLAAAAGVLGVVVGSWMLSGLIHLAPPGIPLLDEVRLDRTVLWFALLVAAGTTLIFGLIPALRLAGTDLQTAIRSDRVGAPRQSRLRGGLVVFEVALSLVLLIGAGLLVRSFVRLRAVDLGFEPDGVLAVSLTPSYSRYPDPPAQIAFYDRLLERLRSIPGVIGATSTSATPADPNAMTFSFAIEGREAPNASGRFDPVPLEAVMTDYFRTMGIPVRQGRTFEQHDRADAPAVAVVNQTLARALWPSTDPVGQRISFAGAQGPWLEIVGVVGDTRMLGADRLPAPALYVPFPQKTWAWLRWQSVLIRARTQEEALSLTGAVAAAIAEIDPQLVLPTVTTVNQLYTESAARRRFATVLLGAFAGVALVLGIIGIYGVLSTAVAQRREELAVRVTLGATRTQVIGLVVRQALGLTLTGVAVGLLVAGAMTRVLSTLLFGVSPLDPLVFGLVSLLILAVSLITALLPAWRATRVDPLAALRGT